MSGGCIIKIIASIAKRCAPLSKYLAPRFTWGFLSSRFYRRFYAKSKIFFTRLFFPSSALSPLGVPRTAFSVVNPFYRGFGKQYDLFDDAFANMQKRKPQGNRLRKLEVFANTFRVIVTKDFYAVLVRTGQTHLPCCFENRQVIRFDID